MTERSWLFVLTFPNGGSTALAKLLLTAPKAIALTHKAEGQWLVPSLCAPVQRWNTDAVIDFEEVRSRWTAEAENLARAKDLTGDYVVIEKSPPNMCRHKALVSAFESDRTHLAILTRDPLATCASWHSRYRMERVVAEWGFSGKIPTNDDEFLAALAEIWLQRAALLDRARDDACAMFRYEDLVENPPNVVAGLVREIPQLEGIDFSATVTVKDYPPQRLRNMNDETVRKLSEAQRGIVLERLRRQADLVERLGYSVETGLRA